MFFLTIKEFEVIGNDLNDAAGSKTKAFVGHIGLGVKCSKEVATAISGTGSGSGHWDNKVLQLLPLIFQPHELQESSLVPLHFSRTLEKVTYVAIAKTYAYLTHD